MKKLYFLPISMILMTTGYADEPQEIQSENVAIEKSVQNLDTEKKVERQAAAAPSRSPAPPTDGPTAPFYKPEGEAPRDSHSYVGATQQEKRDEIEHIQPKYGVKMTPKERRE